MTPELIASLTTGIVAIIGAVFAGIRSIQAGRSATSAHARIDALQQDQQAKRQEAGQ